MGVVYGVGVANRFAFLLEDGDEEEETVIIKSAEVGQKKAGTKGVEESKALLKNQNQPIANVANKEVKNHRGSKKETREGGLDKGQGQRRDRNEESSENDGNSRQERRPRVPRGDAPQPHSQRKFRGRLNSPEKKKDVPKESGENDENTENKPDEGVDTENAKEEGERIDETEASKEQVPTITLKEWKAMQAPREKPVYNTRKPGEGEDPRFLEKFVLKKKEVVVNEDAGDDEDEAYYPQRAGKMKPVADVGFTTGYQRRRMGPGRGGGPGGRGRFGGGDAQDAKDGDSFAENVRGRRRDNYGDNYQRRPAPVPRIDDALDFPSLG